MYFPYLRGKQFELLALRELSHRLGESKQIVPILEPVRIPDGSGLERCLTSLSSERVSFILVVNPSVGDLRQESRVSEQLADFVTTDDARFNDWNLGLIIDERTDIDGLVGNYRTLFNSSAGLSLIHRGRCDNLGKLLEITRDLNRKYDVVDANLRKRHYRDLLESSQGVTLNDPFPMQDKNAAYLDLKESLFSEEHLYYLEEGWFGFADFLTIGENYSESGFTPRAVVIHWTYQPNNLGPIMIRHFTSDNNQDTSNVGGKFLQALEKLVRFLDENEVHTHAAEIFRGHLRNQTYPGLGIIKKLSIENHLELVADILARQ